MIIFHTAKPLGEEPEVAVEPGSCPCWRLRFRHLDTRRLGLMRQDRFVEIKLYPPLLYSPPIPRCKIQTSLLLPFSLSSVSSLSFSPLFLASSLFLFFFPSGRFHVNKAIFGATFFSVLIHGALLEQQTSTAAC